MTGLLSSRCVLKLSFPPPGFGTNRIIGTCLVWLHLQLKEPYGLGTEFKAISIYTLALV